MTERPLTLRRSHVPFAAEVVAERGVTERSLGIRHGQVPLAAPT
ncbi:hypothetical protein [Nocardia iowensis]|nr:hypothetical protein [Nocardia iowensis]